MFQSPSFFTGDDSQYPRKFMFQPPPTTTNIINQYKHLVDTNDIAESPNAEL